MPFTETQGQISQHMFSKTKLIHIGGPIKVEWSQKPKSCKLNKVLLSSLNSNLHIITGHSPNKNIDLIVLNQILLIILGCQSQIICTVIPLVHSQQ